MHARFVQAVTTRTFPAGPPLVLLLGDKSTDSGGFSIAGTWGNQTPL